MMNHRDISPDGDSAARNPPGGNSQIDIHKSESLFAAQDNWLKRLFHPSRSFMGSLVTSGEFPTGTSQETEGTESENLAGQIRGRFTLTEKLGQGAYGAVYRAYDNVLQRPVAIKLPTRDVVGNQHDYERFRLEALSAASLNHHGIVRVFDAGEFDDGTPYISMEFCAGPSLAAWLQEFPSGELINPRTAAHIVALMAEAVEHAHEKGIVHRDLKPDNTLLEPLSYQGQSQFGIDLGHSLNVIPRICDFGLAKQGTTHGEEWQLEESTIAGTAYYMSPEQLTGSVGPCVDIFALGVILHVLLTRQFPFLGESWQELYTCQMTPPTQSLRRIPNLHRDLEAICLKCLAFDVNRRYASAGALAQDLRCFLVGDTVTARKPPLPERLVRYARKHRFTTGLLLTITMGLIGTSIGFWQAHSALQTSFLSRGTLALQSGQWEEARRAFQFKSVQMGPRLIDAELGHALSLLASDRVLECLHHTTKALESAVGKKRAELLLIQGEARFASSIEPEIGRSSIRQALETNELSDGDRAYAEALVADSSPIARRLLQQAISLDGRHQRAHRKLLCVELLSGDFMAAHVHLDSMRMMFPEDWCPEAVECMLDLVEREGQVESGKNRFAQLAGKIGLDRSHLLQAEFDLMANVIAIITAPEDSEPKILVALDNAFGDMYSTVRDSLHSEGYLSIGLARPVLPCVYEAHRQLAQAGAYKARHKIEETRASLAAAADAHPEALILYYKGLFGIQLVLDQATGPEPRKSLTDPGLVREFWESILAFEKAGQNDGLYQAFRNDALQQVVNGCHHFLTIQQLTPTQRELARDKLLVGIARIKERIQPIEGNCTREVRLFTQGLAGWSFPIPWIPYGQGWVDDAIRNGAPELAAEIAANFLQVHPDDPDIFLRSSKAHAEHGTWLESLNHAEHVVSMGATPEEQVDASEIADRARAALRARLGR